MRELKFRVWDCEESEFLQVSSLGIEDDGSVWYVQAIDDREVKIDPPYFPDSDKIEIMQYTGLKDKNGVEIYEGDILDYQWKSSTRNLLLVEWSDQDACFFIGGVKTDYAIAYGEVIGNKFENPELLN